MVKSRKTTTTVQYQLLPNYYDSTATAGLGRKNVLTDVAAANNKNATTSTTNKRPIFHHLTRLHHGILRYRNIVESPTSVTSMAVQQGGRDKDREFVYVPAGYATQNDQCLSEILAALRLNQGLPPLLVVTAATEGAVQETLADDNGGQGDCFDDTDGQLGTASANEEEEALFDLTAEEERELLREKTHEMLRSTVELCAEVGAWVLPHRPRRVNGAAEVLCGAIPRDTETTTTTATPPIILGMIGLDQQDRKEGFTALITSHIYPVGVGVSKAAEVCYDPNVMDNTPCPELTHLLIFERRQEMRAFREQMVSRIPNVFLAFGTTTTYAKQSLFSALVSQSPVALITHTSKEIDRMSRMLKHADREMRKLDVGAIEPSTTSSTSGTHKVSGAPTTYSTLPVPSLRELEVSDTELAQFLTKWPAAHDDERVVLADPRRVGGVQFRQKLLRAINAAFYLQVARKRAIEDAVVLLHSIETTSDHQKQVSELYHLKMVLSTLTAVVAAVLYAKIYIDTPPPSWENRNPYQMALFLATICIPFLTLAMKKAHDRSSRSWSSIQDDAGKLQSAIYEFRTRPRSYGHQSTSSSSSQREPLEAFSHFVGEIKSRVLPSLVVESEPTLDGSVNGVSSPSSSGEQVVPAHTEEFDVEAPPPTESSPLLLPPAIATARVSASAALEWKKPMNSDNHRDKHQYQGVKSDKMHANKKDDEGGANPKSKDNYSLLTIKEYIDCRIHAERDRKTMDLQTLEQRNTTLEGIIKVVMASTSLLAVLSQQIFIPIVLGISAAGVATQDFRKYQKRLEQGEAMIAQLDDLLSWWGHLDTEEKISNANEDRLVFRAESIIVADVSYTY